MSNADALNFWDRVFAESRLATAQRDSEAATKRLASTTKQQVEAEKALQPAREAVATALHTILIRITAEEQRHGQNDERSVFDGVAFLVALEKTGFVVIDQVTWSQALAILEMQRQRVG